MFVKTSSGEYVNTDYIRWLKIHTNSYGDVTVVAETGDEKVIVAECNDRDDAEVVINCIAGLINGQ